MNNTKWKEIFNYLVEKKLQFSIHFLKEKDYFNNGKCYHVVSRDIGDVGINDPGFCGPFFYKSIKSIKIPKTINFLDRFRESSQSLRIITQDIEEFHSWLLNRGLFQLNVTSDYLEITGNR